MSYSFIVDRVVEPAIIYTGTVFHYVAQGYDLLEVETGVNIVLGLGVTIYTILKIVQIIVELKERGDDGLREEIQKVLDEISPDDT